LETGWKPPTDWPAIRGDYERTAAPLRVIGAHHGVSHTAIRKRAAAEGWTRGAAPAMQGGAKAAFPSNEDRAERSKRRRTRFPKAILQDIAESELAPADARVNACKVLLDLDRRAKPTAEDANEIVNRRALQIVAKNGRRIR
jgi:hypothetical protein